MHLDERGMSWAYSVCAAVALLVALALPGSAKTIRREARGRYWILQAITLAGAVIGAKLAMLGNDYGWSIEPRDLLFSGKSIVGGLLGGFIAAEIAKGPLNYRERPNDWFAVKLLLSILI